MTNQSGVRARWYLLALVPLAVGAGVMGFGLYGLFDAVRQMPRVVVPGSGEVTLEAGDYIAFGETHSRVGDNVYVVGSLQLRCGMRAAQGGEPVALTTPTMTSQYSGGGFAGQSMFALTIPRAGTYQVACEGTGGPATLAFGTGIGTSIVVSVLSLFAGIGAAVVTLVVVRRRRRRARAANELAGLPEARAL